MINVNDLKTGITIGFDGNIYQVIEFMHVKPGKGPAFVRTRLKNLRSGATIDHTFNAGIKVEKASINKIAMQFLYASGDTYNFMNMETFEQIELDKKQIKDEVLFLKEGLNIDLTFFDTELLGMTLPDKIEYTVTHTEPSVKGNSVNNANKEAVVETGLVVKVPLFIEQGEVIIVSTKDGKYDSRA